MDPTQDPEFKQLTEHRDPASLDETRPSGESCWNPGSPNSSSSSFIVSIITVRRYASAVYAVVMCQSACLRGLSDRDEFFFEPINSGGKTSQSLQGWPHPVNYHRHTTSSFTATDTGNNSPATI